MPMPRATTQSFRLLLRAWPVLSENSCCCWCQEKSVHSRGRNPFLPFPTSKYYYSTLPSPADSLVEHRKSAAQVAKLASGVSKSDEDIVEDVEQSVDGFEEQLPDFLLDEHLDRRDLLKVELGRLDMLRRRTALKIPEFYVGSILAVVVSEKYAEGRKNRFVGVCVRRKDVGLQHSFTLRNFIDRTGVEIKYDLYNPTIQSIEVLKLEKWLDADLRYLRDCDSQYSIVPVDMEAIAIPNEEPVPVNEEKAQLKMPPWSSRWEIREENVAGLCVENIWSRATPYYKRKYKMSREVNTIDYEKYDLLKNEAKRNSLEEQQEALRRIRDFEAANPQYGRVVELHRRHRPK